MLTRARCMALAANLWLVYLEGSMFCWSAESCDLRYSTHPFYMSRCATQSRKQP